MVFLIYNPKIFATNTIDQIRDRGYIILATNAELDPFEYKDGDEITGIDIDVAKQIAKRIGVDLKITDVSFDALTLELSGGNCDFVLAAMSYSDDRAKTVDFSQSYLTSKQVMLLPKNSTINSVSDLNSKRIGVKLGESGDIYCTERFKNSKISRYSKGSEAVLDMIYGRIDVVVTDDIPAKKLLYTNRGDIKISDTYLFEEQYRAAVPKGNSELLSVINVILNELKEEGIIDEIVNSYVSEPKDFGKGLVGLIYSGLIYKNRYRYIIEGLGNTLQITCGALIMGVAIGSGIAFIKLNKSKKIIMKILDKLADLYLMVIRGTPMVVQLFAMYYMVFVTTDLSKHIVAMIAFGINSGAYVGVVLQAGILSVDKGQYEAARSLGLSNKQSMIKVVFPQALKNIIATLCNEFIALIKETSVAGFIGIIDLSRASDVIRSQTLEPFVPLASVSIIYLLIVAAVSSIMSMVERRLRQSDLR